MQGELDPLSRSTVLPVPKVNKEYPEHIYCLMPKTKKQSKAQKPKPRPVKKSQPKPMGPRRIPKHVVSKVCALTDPFCHHSSGVQYPDNSPVRTVPFQYKEVATITTNAAGSGAYLILPNYYTYGYVGGAMSGNTFTTDTNTTLQGKIPNVSQFRIVNWGVRIKSLSAPLYASGMVRVRALNETDGSSFATLDVGSYNRSQVADIPLKDAHDIAVIGPPTQQPRPQLYTLAQVQPTLATTAWQAAGFSAVTVAIVGGPANTAALELEFTYNFELVFESGEGLSQLAKNPPRASAPLANSAAVVTSHPTSIYERGVSQASRTVEALATAAIASAGDALFDLGMSMLAL